MKILLSMDDVGYNEKVDVIVGDVEVDDIVIVVDDGDIIVVDVNNVWDDDL